MKARDMRLLGALASAIVVAVGCASDTVDKQSAAVNPNPILPNFVVYAQLSVNLGASDSVTGGDVGVATVAQSGFGPQLIVNTGAHVDASHALISPSVSLASGAVVGDIQTTTLTNTGGTYGTLAPFPSSMPPLPLGTRSASGTNVTVSANQQTTITPGNYGDVNIAGNGTLILSSGTYTFTSVTIANTGHLQASAATVVNVSGAFSAGTSTSVVPSTGNASDLSITVSGNDAGSTPVASVGSMSTLTALFASPRGTLSLSDHVTARGAFSAFSVSVGPSTTLTYQTGLPTPAVGAQVISSYVNPGSAAPVLAPIAATQQVSVTISLPVRNPTSLANLVAQVTDPTNVNFRKFISTPAFASAYGSTSLGAIMTWAGTNHLTRSAFANRIVVDVYGAASDIETAFFVNLVTGIRPDGTTFIEPDRTPSVSTTAPVLSVQGLDNFIVPKPLGSGGSGANGSFVSHDFRAAFLGCTPLNGAGQTVGIFEPTSVSFNPADIAQYNSLTGLTSSPAVQLVTTCASTLGGIPPGQNNLENSLDPEVAQAMAPGAQVIVFHGNTNSAFAAMAQPNVPLTCGAPSSRLSMPNQISSSYGSNWDQGTFQIYEEFAVQGQSVFQASGDSGMYQVQACGTNTPDNPGDIRAIANPVGTPAPVTLVGGTSLTMTNDGSTYAGEGAWGGSGGGFFSSVAIASYQLGFPGVTGTLRNVPDVALPADNTFVVYSTSTTQGVQSSGVNGTSISAPLMAGFMANVNQANAQSGQPATGFANPVLYRLFPNGFNDVISGSNANICGNGSNAGPGYDLVTGLGSPQCLMTVLIPAFVPPQPQLLVHISSGNDGLNTASSATIDVVPVSGPNQTFTLKFVNDITLENGQIEDLAFNLNPPLRPQDIQAININLQEHGQSGINADNWDIGGLQVRLGNSVASAPNYCVVNLSGNGFCDTFQPSCDASGYLADTTDTGLARLSESPGTHGQGTQAAFPGGSGCFPLALMGTAQPFDNIAWVVDTVNDDLKPATQATLTFFSSAPPPNNVLATLTIHPSNTPLFDNNTEHGAIFQLTPPNGSFSLSQVDHVTLDIFNEGNDEWHVSGVGLYGLANAAQGVQTCILHFGGNNNEIVLNASTPSYTLPLSGCP